MAKPSNKLPFSSTTPLTLGPAYGLREGSGTSTADDAGVGQPATRQGGAVWVSTPDGPVIRTAAPGDFLEIPVGPQNPFEAQATAYTVIAGFTPLSLPGNGGSAVHKRLGYTTSAFGITNTGPGVLRGVASTPAGELDVTTADSPTLSGGTAYIAVLRVQTGSPVRLRVYDRATGQLVGESVSAANLSSPNVTFVGGNQPVRIGTRFTGEGSIGLPGDYEFLFYSPGYLTDQQLDTFAAAPYANYTGLPQITPGTISFGTTTANSVVVNLTGTSGGQTPYSIQFQRAPNNSGAPGAWTNVGTASAATSYTATGLTAATSYWFRALVNDSVGSAPATTTAANVTTAGASGLMIGPPTLSTPAFHRVAASWRPAINGTAPYSYQLQRAPNNSGSPGTWTNVGTAGSATSKTDLGLDPGAGFYYRVVATDSASGSATSSAASVVTTLPDIPGYPTWWGRMKSVAASFNPSLTATTAEAGNLNVQTQLNHDGAFGAIQGLALRPGDADLITYRNNHLRLYRDAYLVPNNGALPTYYVFPEGLGLDWELNGSTASRDALLLLRSHPAYVIYTGYGAATAPDQAYSREVGYAILTQIEVARLGLGDVDGGLDGTGTPDQAWFTFLINCALGHINQWLGDPAVWVAQGSAGIQGFMMGITGLALSRYSDLRAAEGLPADPRVLPALIRLAVRIRERFWRSSSGDFIWPIAPDGTQFANGDPTDRNNGDLNLETTNFFGWLYSRTGSDYFRIAGDDAFAAGIQVGIAGPKQWNQMFRWSFLYTAWRQATPIDDANSYVIDAPFVPKGQVGSASAAFRVVPLKPITGTITPNDNGAGGTFNPSSLAFSNSMTPASFTYIPTSAGAKQIGATNTAGATDPAVVGYAGVAPAGGGSGGPVYPPADKVQAGTVYGPNGNDYTGTLAAAQTPIFPASNQVLAGVVFGPTGSTSTGTVALPAANQVLAGVAFGPGSGVTGALATGSGPGLTTDQVRAACVAAIDATPVRVDMTQPLADVTTPTLGGALHGAWANCWGKTTRDRVDRTLRVFGIGSQAVPAKTFSLDNADNPTTKVPQ